MSKRKKHTFTISEAAKKKLALNLPYSFSFKPQTATCSNRKKCHMLSST